MCLSSLYSHKHSDMDGNMDALLEASWRQTEGDKERAVTQTEHLTPGVCQIRQFLRILQPGTWILGREVSHTQCSSSVSTPGRGTVGGFFPISFLLTKQDFDTKAEVLP